MMKKTRVVDRNFTVKDNKIEKGVITELMVAQNTCPTTKLLGTYVVIPPGSRSPMRCHENAELAWYLVKGHINHIIVTTKDQVVTETECGNGAAGYIAPGDAHQEINLSETEPAELIMAYANPDNKDCNSIECVGTKILKNYGR